MITRTFRRRKRFSVVVNWSTSFHGRKRPTEKSFWVVVRQQAEGLVDAVSLLVPAATLATYVHRFLSPFPGIFAPEIRNYRDSKLLGKENLCYLRWRLESKKMPTAHCPQDGARGEKQPFLSVLAAIVVLRHLAELVESHLDHSSLAYSVGTADAYHKICCQSLSRQ